jgi:hypothetical protein
MAQFDYLSSWKDSWTILSAILEPGNVSVIPDLKYDQPQVQYLTTLDEVRDHCLHGNRKLFIYSESFAVTPPGFLNLDTGVNAGRYVVNDGVGGPLLVLVLPACYYYNSDANPTQAFEGGTNVHLAAGMLYHPRQYWNPETTMSRSPSDSLRAGYKEILRRIKTRLVRHRFHKPIWIGKDALQQVQEKKATIHGFGLNGHHSASGQFGD